jgi:HEAT repeat protein
MKSVLICLLGLLLVAGCSRREQSKPVPEPSYNGKKLSAWLRDITQDANANVALSDSAKDAVRNLGTNALLWLVSELKVPDWQGQFGTHPASDRHRDALLGLDVLGSEAAAAVTEISPLFEVLDNYSDARYSAIKALTKMGPRAVPILIVGLKHPDYNTRAKSAEALVEIEPLPTNAVPSLLIALKDPNARVRAAAAEALGKTHAEPETVVPALLQLFRIAPEFVIHPPPEPSVVTDRSGKPTVVLMRRFTFQHTNAPSKPSLKSQLVRSWSLSSKARALNVPQDHVPPIEVAENLRVVRVSVVEALGNYGPDAKDALPEFKAYLQTPRPTPEGSHEEITDRLVRNAIKDALARIASQTTIPNR